MGEQWSELMKPFLESDKCNDIYTFLRSQTTDRGKRICPESHQTFRAFKETPVDKLCCLWMLQDPYPWIKKGIYVADGIAMSCSNTGYLQPSLELWYNGLMDDLPGYGGHETNPDLAYLCNQGVMMMNSALTVEEGKPSSHSNVKVMGERIRLWEPFMRYFLEDVISSLPKGIVIVLGGRESQYYEKFINPLQHYILKCEHPAVASHQQREWDHDHIFRKINRLVLENRGREIDWMLKGKTRNKETKQSNGQARNGSSGAQSKDGVCV